MLNHNIIHNLSLFGLVERLHLSVFSKVSSALWNNDLWSSLDVNTDSVLDLWVLDGNDRSLESAIEWTREANSALLLSNEVMNWDISILEPLEERDLSSVSDWDIERVLGHLDVGGVVEDDRFLELLDD